MSKIGDYNLMLQEQAEELGFETAQEALEGGYTVSDGRLCHPPRKSRLESVLDGLDDVLEYLKEECDSEECDRTAHMIDNVRQAEQFLLDNYKKLGGGA